MSPRMISMQINHRFIDTQNRIGMSLFFLLENTYHVIIITNTDKRWMNRELYFIHYDVSLK